MPIILVQLAGNKVKDFEGRETFVKETWFISVRPQVNKERKYCNHHQSSSHQKGRIAGEK